MFVIDIKSHRSIQEQVVDNFKELIVTNILKPDDKFPSVRELSKTLAINPNTVQKAYSKLEEEGFLYVVKGKGSYVCDVKKRSIDRESVDQIKKYLKDSIDKLYYLGLSVDEIVNIVDEIVKERGE